MREILVIGVIRSFDVPLVVMRTKIICYEVGPTLPLYRVTIQLEQNFPLTSKQKFRFGLGWPGLARPKQNFCFEVNGRFCIR